MFGAGLDEDRVTGAEVAPLAALPDPPGSPDDDVELVLGVGRLLVRRLGRIDQGPHRAVTQAGEEVLFRSGQAVLELGQGDQPVAHTVTCAPSSTTRPGGILKKSVGLA